MKKSIVIFLLLVKLMFLLSACQTSIEEIPFGIWRSESPNIVLFIDPMKRSPMDLSVFLGIYTKDCGEKIKVAVMVSSTPSGFWQEGRTSFEIYDVSGVASGNLRGPLIYTTRETGFLLRDENILLVGEGALVGEHEKNASLVFERIEYHDLINTEDWFPMGNLRGVWQSDDENLILYFEMHYRSDIMPNFLGINKKGDENQYFYVTFPENRSNISLLDIETGASIFGTGFNRHIFGSNEDFLQIVIRAGFQGNPDITKINFWRIENYPPFDVNNWK